MKQNKYDDPQFFARYSALARSVGGLGAAGEWHVLREMLPGLRDKRVLDLGCGFGWHCRYAREQGARRVVGVDLSERMLERARAINADPDIEYRQGAIEDIDFAAGSFDVVFSSLAFHYVAQLEPVFGRVFDTLTPGGSFVFSMEHPIVTAREQQDWHYGPNGERLHWPVDHYQSEGARHSAWMTDDIVKYHRTIATIINAVVGAGFRIERIEEPQPPPELADRDEMKDESRRPLFILVGATRP